MLFFANAKINIGLFVTGKRNDGFHTIETVFYPVDWKDMIEFLPSKNEALTINHTGIALDLASPADDLVVKAYQLLQNEYQLPPVHFHIHKIIPSGAGLGGGSSDAAHTLDHLNQFFELGLSDEKLAEYAGRLGSDCPFFIKNQPVVAFERGDVFQQVDLNLQGYYLAIICPNIHVATKEAYQNMTPALPKNHLSALIQHPIENWHQSVTNDFEDYAFRKHPQIQSIKAKLYEQGAVFALMSGSGSAVFGIFKERPMLSIPEFRSFYRWQQKL